MTTCTCHWAPLAGLPGPAGYIVRCVRHGGEAEAAPSTEWGELDPESKLEVAARTPGWLGRLLAKGGSSE
jgi:hypothetical protein